MTINTGCEVETDYCGRLRRNQQQQQPLRANLVSVGTNDAAERLLHHCSSICHHSLLPQRTNDGDDNVGQRFNDETDIDTEDDAVDRLSLENTRLNEGVIRDDDRDFYRQYLMRRRDIPSPRCCPSFRSPTRNEPLEPHRRSGESKLEELRRAAEACQQVKRDTLFPSDDDEEAHSPSPAGFSEEPLSSPDWSSEASGEPLLPKPSRPSTTLTTTTTMIPQRTKKTRERTSTTKRSFRSTSDAKHSVHSKDSSGRVLPGTLLLLRGHARRRCGCGGRRHTANCLRRHGSNGKSRTNFNDCSCSSSSGKKKFSFCRRRKNNVAKRRRFGRNQELHLLLHELLLLLQHLQHDRGQFLSAALSQWTNWKVAYSIPGFSALSKPP